uniref:Secreted protein n=1 Tax=Anguilla anguilla TaxID=7936 RepID=A0A0E9UK32_ANGAN
MATIPHIWSCPTSVLFGLVFCRDTSSFSPAVSSTADSKRRNSMSSNELRTGTERAVWAFLVLMWQ